MKKVSRDLATEVASQFALLKNLIKVFFSFVLCTHLAHAQAIIPIPEQNIVARGTLKNVRIQIPQKYHRSLLILLPDMGEKYFGVDDLKKINTQYPSITSFGVILRASNNEPISDDNDFKDWAGNYLKPYSKVDPNHRWTMLGVSAGRNLEKNIDQVMQDASDQSKKMKCDVELLYGLKHCYEEGKEDSGLKINEYFFDSSKETFIACRHNRKYKIFSCSHFFASERNGINYDVSYTSETELKNWKNTEQKMRVIGNQFFAN